MTLLDSPRKPPPPSAPLLTSWSIMVRFASWPCFAFWALTLVARSAGVMDASDFATQTVESIERMVATDLMAPMLLTRLLLPGMIARRQGIIITISSMCVGLRCCFALTQRGIADARVTAAWAFFRRPSAAYTALPRQA